MSVSLHLAVDLGASGGRLALGRLEGDQISLEILHRFENGPVLLGDHLHWDVPRLWQEILTGLRKAPPRVRTVSVDAWGVDFALLGPDGALVSLPRHYRDPQHVEAFHRVLQEQNPWELYRRTGIQLMPINTLYQLVALRDRNPRLLEATQRFLMLPDLFHYWLSGVAVCEWTNVSTTQLADPWQRNWAGDLIEALGLPRQIFAEPISPGTILGDLRPALVREIEQNFSVVTPATHDTASAVAAVPSEGSGWAYLIAGTWTLLGIERSAPLVNKATFTYNFTNEGGIDGTFRILRNVMGLWLLQECRRVWGVDFPLIAARALEEPPFRFFVDPDQEDFLPPNEVAGPMPERIIRYLQTTGQGVPERMGQVARAIYEGLGFRYRQILDALEEVVKEELSRVHVVGGGSQDVFFCQTVADITGRLVIAGPVEATLLGNLLVGAKAIGAVEGSIREVVRASVELQTYVPRELKGLEEAYARFLELASSLGRAYEGGESL